MSTETENIEEVEKKEIPIKKESKPKKQNWGGDDDAFLFEEEMSQPKKEEPKAGEGGEDEQLDDEDFGAPESVVIEDADLEIGKGAIYLFDDLRADGFSLYVAGDLSESERFQRYKNLNSPRHRTLTRAAALLSKQYRLERSPWLIILVTLLFSSFGVGKEAYNLKKERKTAKEAAQQPAATAKDNIRQMPKAKLYKDAN